MTNILGKNLLFIVAHPDDETFLASGTIDANSKAGGHNAVFCATKGERGRAYLDTNMSVNDLKYLRSKEFNSVMDYLRVQKSFILDLPDGDLENNKKKLEEEIKYFINDIFIPDFIVSFGPDGYTGHKDHIAIGSVSEHISNEINVSFLKFAIPNKNIFPDFIKYLHPKQIHGCYEKDFIYEEANIHIEVDGELKNKVLELYKSQYKGLNPHRIFSVDIAEHFLNNEYFIF